jgi:hypothetical protein
MTIRTDVLHEETGATLATPATFVKLVARFGILDGNVDTLSEDV